MGVGSQMVEVLFTCDKQLDWLIWSPGAAVLFLQQGLNASDSSFRSGVRGQEEGLLVHASLCLSGPPVTCWSFPGVPESVTKTLLGEI